MPNPFKYPDLTLYTVEPQLDIASLSETDRNEGLKEMAINNEPESRPEDPCSPPWFFGTSWEHQKPPSEKDAHEAFAALRNVLHPRRDQTGQKAGFKSPSVDGWALSRLRDIKIFLNLYTAEGSSSWGQWMVSSEDAI